MFRIPVVMQASYMQHYLEFPHSRKQPSEGNKPKKKQQVKMSISIGKLMKAHPTVNTNATTI